MHNFAWSRSKRGEKRATDSNTSPPPGLQSGSQPIRVMLVIRESTPWCPRSDYELDSAKECNASRARDICYMA